MATLRNFTILFAIGMLCFLVGCGKQEAIPQSEWEAMIAIRAEAAAHHQTKTFHDFQIAIGETPADVAQLNEMAQHLFTRDNIDLLQRIENSFEPSREETQVRRLRHYLIDGLIELTLEPERRYISKLAQRPIELPDGFKITLHDFPQALATETNRERRELIYNSQLPMLQRINAVKEVELQRLDSLLMSLDYGSVTSYYQEVRGYDLAELAVTAQQVLAESDSLMSAALQRFAPLLTGVSADALRAWDISILAHSDFFATVLTPEAIDSSFDELRDFCEAINDTLAGLTSHWPTGGNVVRRSSTYAISAPDDIRVVVAPPTGVMALSNYSHEIGHALHYLNTEEREFEFNYLGGAAERELLAFVVQEISGLRTTSLRPLVMSHLDNKSEYQARMTELSQRRALNNLLTLRSHCVDFLYEYRYFAGLEDPRASFAESRARLYNHPIGETESELYLGRLSMFESADYLVARLGAANVRRYFDDQDSAEPGAQISTHYLTLPTFAEFLRESWRQGTALTLADLSTRLGRDILFTEPLITYTRWQLEEATRQPTTRPVETTSP